jgi:AbrB family looped-hinge helix DNA binding protein
LTQIYNILGGVRLASWRDMLNSAKRPAPTKVSRNGQIVLPARARRVAGIAPGDLVVTVPVAPGAVLVEKVGAPLGDWGSWKEFLDSEENPLAGAYGPDAQAYVDELRGPWPEPAAS